MRTAKIPIVFWASLPPWPSEISDAERNCIIRNLRSMVYGALRTKIHDTRNIRNNARVKPISGDRMIAEAVFPTPAQTTALSPALAMPAPIKPPIRACELLEGMPRRHVINCQTIAPASAPKTRRGVTRFASTMPVPTVSATCNPKNRNAMKLKKAAHATAYCGLSTRVETMVAIELAASFMPLRKSNASATMISPISSGNPSEASIWAIPAGSDVIDHDALNFVGDVVEAVDHLFQVVVDLVAGDESHGIARPLRLEKLSEPEIVQVVGAAFDLRDLLGERADAAGLLADRAQERHRFLDQHGALHDGVAHLLHLRREGADVEQHHRLRGLLHLVDGIVHRRDEILDVAAIERRDEGAPDRDQHVPRDGVRVVLAVHHGAVMRRHGLAAIEQGAQRLGAGHDGLRVAGEQVEETLFLGHQGVEPAKHDASPQGGMHGQISPIRGPLIP